MLRLEEKSKNTCLSTSSEFCRRPAAANQRIHTVFGRLTLSCIHIHDSCRAPEHVTMSYQDKCEFFLDRHQPVTPKRQSPQQWYYYWGSAWLTAEAFTGGLEFLLSSAMPVEKRRSEWEQEFDGQSDEVAQPGVSNGDVHLLLYAKYSLRKQHGRSWEKLDKGLFREPSWETMAWKQTYVSPVLLPFQRWVSSYHPF